MDKKLYFSAYTLNQPGSHDGLTFELTHDKLGELLGWSSTRPGVLDLFDRLRVGQPVEVVTTSTPRAKGTSYVRYRFALVAGPEVVS